MYGEPVQNPQLMEQPLPPNNDEIPLNPQDMPTAMEQDAASSQIMAMAPQNMGA